MKRNGSEKSPFEIAIERLEARIGDNILLAAIKKTRDINFVDDEGQTILHHLIKDISCETIKTLEQLNEVVGIIKQLSNLVSDNALNLPDSFGQSALELAANCEVREIFWAVLDRGLPDYETPLFGKPPTYVSTYKGFSSQHEVFSSFAASSWGISSVDSCSSQGSCNSQALGGLSNEWGYSDSCMFN